MTSHDMTLISDSFSVRYIKAVMETGCLVQYTITFAGVKKPGVNKRVFKDANQYYCLQTYKVSKSGIILDFLSGLENDTGGRIICIRQQLEITLDYVYWSYNQL